MSTCIEQLSTEVRRFEAVAYFSLALTFVCYLFRKTQKNWMDAHPDKASKGLFRAASIKIFLSLLLFTVLNPSCPTGCDCGDYHQSYIYPTIVLVVGLLWLGLGYRYHKMAYEPIGVMDGGETDEHRDDTVYRDDPVDGDKPPASEMKVTSTENEIV